MAATLQRNLSGQSGLSSCPTWVEAMVHIGWSVLCCAGLPVFMWALESGADSGTVWMAVTAALMFTGLAVFGVYMMVKIGRDPDAAARAEQAREARAAVARKRPVSNWCC
jgi:hypothetical protein